MKNNQENTYTRKKKFWKFWLLMIFINIGLIIVIARLFQLQILNASYYKEKARRQHETKVSLSAQRGNIYDRNGNLLASSVKSYSIAVDPNLLQHKTEILQIIEKNTGISTETLNRKILSAKGSFVWLVRGITPEKIRDLLYIKDKGLILIEEPKRQYHYGTLASQVIGCTDIDSRGLTGIELSYDSILTGRSGYMVMFRDGLGRLRPSADLPIIHPTNGYSIQLTLDIELQRIVEFELMQGVKNSLAESGTVVAIKPSTGEILAMSTYPNFNPNDPATYINSNMRNRAITDVYEPGSTFKVVTAAAAIEEKITSLNDKYNGFQGELHFANYVIRDVHPLGIATFRDGLVYSSNIILSSVAAKIPDYKFYKYIRDFGFGISTGIDLPGEVAGKIQRAEQMNVSTKRFIGFGYGIMSTPLQLLNAFATVANKGIMMKPYIINALFDERGNLIKKFSPEKIRRVISENTSKMLTDVLKEVVERGTGTAAKIEGVKIAGKTGTSQQIVDGTYSKADYNASFVGYFPADNPQICIIVFLDKPKTSIYGGSTAAPIFKNIALRWLSLKNHSPNEKDIENNPWDTVYVPNINGLLLTEAENILSELGLRWSSSSKEGIVKSTFPKAGERILRSTSIKIETIQDTLSLEKMPSVVGLSLRRAVTILHTSGIKVNIRGSGRVVRQIWEKNSKGETTCTLIANPD